MFDLDGMFAGLELVLDETVVAQIRKDLHEIASQVHDTHFQGLQPDQSAFGGSSIGDSLGYHHSLAHAKVSESLTAVLADLKTFSDGFAVYQKSLTDADGGSAADSRTISTAISKLDRSTGFTHTHGVDHQHHTHSGGSHG